jgi:hypothetical protein
MVPSHDREKTQWSYEGISTILSVQYVQNFSLSVQERNCFLEFHDDRILDPTKAAAETVLAVDPEEEIAVQTVETDPLAIYPSSDSSDDSDFDVLDNPVNDGVLLDEDEWLK